MISAGFSGLSRASTACIVDSLLYAIWFNAESVGTLI